MAMSMFDDQGGYRLSAEQRKCRRCGHVLVDEDELGPYYQVPVAMEFPPDLELPVGTVLTFMDRVHECGGEPHQMTGATAGDPQWIAGDGATLHWHTDAHAYTVIAVTAKTFTMQRDKVTLDPAWKRDFHPGGFLGHTSNDRDQRWTYERDPDGPTRTVRLTKRGWMSNGQRVTPGRHEFYDSNF